MDGTHSCGPHCERVPCLKRRIEELQFELSSYEESDANLQKKVKELEAEFKQLRKLNDNLERQFVEDTATLLGFD